MNARTTRNRSARRWTLGVATAVLALLLPASLAWACVGIASLTTSPATVQPGGTVSVTGKEFPSKVPVVIHLDAIDGPVLATAPPTKSTMTGQFTIPVAIPANAQSGQHLLIATQDGAYDMNGGIPARALISVGTAAPAPAGPAARPAAVMMDSGLGITALALIGVGVAIGGLLLAGAALALATSRRRSDATPAPAS